MSSVNVLNVQVLQPAARFLDPLQFEITFECISPLQDGPPSPLLLLCSLCSAHLDDGHVDLEWTVTYVGSAESKQHDQVLDSVVLGPIGVGSYKFVLQTKAPQWQLVPYADLIGVTVLLLSCLYKGQEFVRVGYYVSSAYEDLPQQPPTTAPPEQGPGAVAGAATPSASWPNPHDPQRIVRNILADSPRVTLFPIKWDGMDAAVPSPPMQQDVADAEGEEDDDEDDDDDEEDEGDEEEEGEEGHAYNDDEEMTDAHLRYNRRSLFPILPPSLPLRSVLVRPHSLLVCSSESLHSDEDDDDDAMS